MTVGVRQLTIVRTAIIATIKLPSVRGIPSSWRRCSATCINFFICPQVGSEAFLVLRVAAVGGTGIDKAVFLARLGCKDNLDTSIAGGVGGRVMDMNPSSSSSEGVSTMISSGDGYRITLGQTGKTIFLGVLLMIRFDTPARHPQRTFFFAWGNTSKTSSPCQQGP